MNDALVYGSGLNFAILNVLNGLSCFCFGGATFCCGIDCILKNIKKIKSVNGVAWVCFGLVLNISGSSICFIGVSLFFESIMKIFFGK